MVTLVIVALGSVNAWHRIDSMPWHRPHARCFASSVGVAAVNQMEIELRRPLGITVQEAFDGAVYVIATRENAAAAGIQVGDVVIGVSGIFGDEVWNVRGKGVAKVESLIRSRDADTVNIRLERGHSYHLEQRDLSEDEFLDEMETDTVKAIFAKSRWALDNDADDEEPEIDDDEELIENLIDAFSAPYDDIMDESGASPSSDGAR